MAQPPSSLAPAPSGNRHRATAAPHTSHSWKAGLPHSCHTPHTPTPPTATHRHPPCCRRLARRVPAGRGRAPEAQPPGLQPSHHRSADHSQHPVHRPEGLGRRQCRPPHPPAACPLRSSQQRRRGCLLPAAAWLWRLEHWRRQGRQGLLQAWLSRRVAICRATCVGARARGGCRTLGWGPGL